MIEKPDITLEALRYEYQQTYGIQVSIGTMFNTLKRLGFSYKKNILRPPQSSTGCSGAAGGLRKEDCKDCFKQSSLS
jgi:transposase